MQSGRMKGQAFVGMPDGEMAAEALQDTNGYMLHGKPMVVVSSLQIYSATIIEEHKFTVDSCLSVYINVCPHPSKTLVHNLGV